MGLSLKLHVQSTSHKRSHGSHWGPLSRPAPTRKRLLCLSIPRGRPWDVWDGQGTSPLRRANGTSRASHVQSHAVPTSRGCPTGHPTRVMGRHHGTRDVPSEVPTASTVGRNSTNPTCLLLFTTNPTTSGTFPPFSSKESLRAMSMSPIPRATRKRAMLRGTLRRLPRVFLGSLTDTSIREGCQGTPLHTLTSVPIPGSHPEILPLCKAFQSVR